MLALSTDDDIVICDPEREYASLAGHWAARWCASRQAAPPHQRHGHGGGATAREATPWPTRAVRAVTVRAARPPGTGAAGQVGRGPLHLGGVRRLPARGGAATLAHLRDKLLAQPEPQARDLALSLELFTSGTLDAFAHPTNVDTRNRLLVYDIMDLGRQLKTMGAARHHRRDAQPRDDNWRAGRRTHIFIDEFTWCSRTSTPARSSTARGAPLPQAQRLPPRPSRRTWSTCSIRSWLHDALQPPSSSSCSTRRPPTAETGRTPQHQPRADGLHHQRRGGLRPPALRRRHRAVRQPLPGTPGSTAS